MNRYLILKQKLLNKIDFEKKKRQHQKKKLFFKKKTFKLSLNESESSFFSDDKNSNSNFLNNLSIESISFNKINEYNSKNNEKDDNSIKDICKIIQTINENEKILNEKYYNTIEIKEKKIFSDLKNLYKNDNIVINKRKKKFLTIDFQNGMKNQISQILLNLKKNKKISKKKQDSKQKKVNSNHNIINIQNDLNNNKFQKNENFIYKLKMKKFAFNSVKEYFKNYINNPAYAVKTLNYQFDYRLPKIYNNTIENNNNNNIQNLKHHKIKSYDMNLIKNYHNLKNNINSEMIYDRILNNENKTEKENKLSLINKNNSNKKSRNHLINSNFNTTNTIHSSYQKIENLKTLPIKVYKLN